MRAFIFAVILGLVVPFAASAQDRTDITATIDSQIEAFLRDDFATAFTFASPTIQRLFGSSENFGNMVRNGYPMVWRPSRVEYLDLTDENGRTVQKVLIEDQAGQSYVLQYEMIETENGWRINGVAVLRDPGASV